MERPDIRPIYPPDIEDTGTGQLFRNLMEIQARKEARARQQMLDERQREIDRMTAEDRARKIQQEEEDRKLKADMAAKLLKETAAASTKPLPAVKGPQVSIGPSSVKIQAPDIPAELMPTHETPEQFDLRSVAQEGFDLPLGAGMNEKAPDVPELRQYGSSTKVRIPGGETVETPLKYKSDIEEEQNQMLKVVGDALGVDLTGMGQIPPNILPTLISAVGRKGRQKPILDKVDLGNKVRVFYEDGTTEDIPKGKFDSEGGGARPLTQTAEAQVINRLATQWTKAIAPNRELRRQVSLMDTGLDAARRGDMASGSQAVLVTFQKILDPTSVVRESEYARSAHGQSLLARISGAMEKLQKGGAGVPLMELEKFAKLAHEMVAAQEDFAAPTKKRILSTAKRYNIPEELVMEDIGAAPPQAGAAAQPIDPEVQRRLDRYR